MAMTDYVRDYDKNSSNLMQQKEEKKLEQQHCDIIPLNSNNIWWNNSVSEESSTHDGEYQTAIILDLDLYRKKIEGILEREEKSLQEEKWLLKERTWELEKWLTDTIKSTVSRSSTESTEENINNIIKFKK